jgi:hypothetical protein
MPPAQAPAGLTGKERVPARATLHPAPFRAFPIYNEAKRSHPEKLAVAD